MSGPTSRQMSSRHKWVFNLIKHKTKSMSFKFATSIVGISIAALICFILVTNYNKASATATKNQCINNLRQISSAKMLWQLENRKPLTATPTPADLRKYLKSEKMLYCPEGEAYQINGCNKPPTCPHAADGHNL